MKKRLMIAITGNPGSGKTTLLKKLQEKGYKVLEVDRYVEKIYKFPNKGYLSIRKRLGKSFCKNLKVNKEEIKKLIIKENSGKSIENIIFPLIHEFLTKKKFDFVEIPIIYKKLEFFSPLFNEIINLENSKINKLGKFSNAGVDNLTKMSIDILNRELVDIINVNNYVNNSKKIDDILLNY